MQHQSNSVKQPSRRLFQSLENNKLWTNSHDRNNNNTIQTKPLINAQCQQTFKAICQKNLQQFCETYEFDLNQMKPLVESTIHGEANENDRENHNHTRHKHRWHWEQLDTTTTTVNYIPTFYLNNKYHSDSYLLLQSHQLGYSVPPNTPHKSITKSFTNDHKHNSLVSFTLHKSHSPECRSSSRTVNQCTQGEPVAHSSFHVCRVRSRNSSNARLSSGRRSMHSSHTGHIRSKSEGKHTDRIQHSQLDGHLKCGGGGRGDSTCRLSEIPHKLPSYSSLSNSSDSIPCSKDVNWAEKSEPVSYCANQISPCPPSTSNTNFSLKQMKLTDMFPVNKPVKSCTTVCTNS
ncbi:unnamed protein product [Schistosoma turkestanicum]|nr:unnamed protein product [Schistosoma turkestanicum]